MALLLCQLNFVLENSFHGGDTCNRASGSHKRRVSKFVLGWPHTGEARIKKKRVSNVYDTVSKVESHTGVTRIIRVLTVRVKS